VLAFGPMPGPSAVAYILRVADVYGKRVDLDSDACYVAHRER